MGDTADSSNPTEATATQAHEASESKNAELRSSVVSRRSSFKPPPLSRYLSAWVVDLERQKEGYTAGKGMTITAVTCAFLSMVLLTVGYILLFSHIEVSLLGGQIIGFGPAVFTTLIQTGAIEQDLSLGVVSTGIALGVVSAVALIVIYILDVRNWTGMVLGTLKYIIFLITTGLLFVTSLLLTNQLISAPLIAFTVVGIVFLAAEKTVLFPTVQKLYYVRSLMWSSLFCGFLVLALFLYSVFRDSQFYDLQVSLNYHILLECPDEAVNTFEELLDPETLAEFADAGEELIGCDEAFLVWLSPFIFFIGSVMLSGVLGFLHRAEKKRIASKAAVGIEPLAQLFMVFILLGLMGLWMAASISSASGTLGDAVFALSVVGIGVVVIAAVTIFGAKYLISQMKKTSIGLQGYNAARSDWGKGMVVVVGSPIIIVFLAVDALKQFIRRKTCLGKNITEDKERNARFTKPVDEAWQQARQWEMGSVIPKALLLGILSFVLNVGVSRLTLIFLSFVRESLAESSLAATTGFLIVIGLVLFLLPPVPGVPVYITAGVLLPSIAEEQEVMGFTAGIFFAIGISLMLKIMALIMQQKLIGEMCGSRSVSVRYAVGVNSVGIRAIRKVLSQPGLNFGKVAILCGGPDWPTSVLTGILKLSLIQMIIGTLPVAFLIAPCVVSGAMIVKSGEEPDSIFSSISTLSILVTVIVQGGAMLGAAQVLASASTKYAEELKAEEPDQAVLELEQRNKAKSDMYKRVTSWSNLTGFWKFMHVLSLVFMIVSSYAFMLAGGELFESFDIVDSIADDLDGNVLNVVKDAGIVFLSMFFLSCLELYIFKKVHKRKKMVPNAVVASAKSETQADVNLSL